MKNKNSIGYWVLEVRCHKSDVRSQMSDVRYRIFCLLFSVFCSLTYSAAAVGQKSPQKNLTIPPDPNSNFRRQLWRVELSIAKGEKDKRTKDELKRMIEQIRSIELKPDKQTSEPVLVPEVIQTAGLNETLPDKAVPKEQKTKEIGTKLPYEPISDQTLQILKDLSQHLDHLRNSFELGETLFLSGNLKEAAIFYREALKRKSPEPRLRGDKFTPAREPALREPKAGVGSARDRAWILFQIGNCLRNDDPITAMKMYGQLITEYPNSPWKELAGARSKLLNWYLTDKPGELIAEHKL
jgi:tetratricopeptide (TPR) repeat protein